MDGGAGMLITESEALRQITRAGLLDYLTITGVTQSSVHGKLNLEAVPLLSGDKRFARGVLYGLHRDVGTDLTDFRSFGGELGKGSLQIVVDTKTGDCYCDVDRFSPYGDVVGFLGHAFAEVVPHWLMRFRRRKVDGRLPSL